MTGLTSVTLLICLLYISTTIISAPKPENKYELVADKIVPTVCVVFIIFCFVVDRYNYYINLLPEK